LAEYFAHANLLKPPTKRAAYSDRTAWLLAECSALAYLPFEMEAQSLIANLKLGGFELVREFDNGGTQAYLAKRADLAVLAFRGTEQDYGDILTDLKFRMYRDAQGNRTHRGFEAAFSYIKVDVAKAISELEVDLPLYFTGHSLGGALATIATLHFASDQLAACYTFGCPRVGNLEFSQNIKIPVYRVVNVADIVARVPIMVIGYRHVGDLRYLTRDGKLLTGPSAFQTLPQFILSATSNWRSIYHDHFSRAYSQKLAQIAIERNP
jgi:triacylglycerol lipase